jgi:hypothetical protein
MDKDEPRDAPQRQTLVNVVFPSQATLIFFSAIILGFILILLPTVFSTYFALNASNQTSFYVQASVL